jgi:hypothetical protein
MYSCCLIFHCYLLYVFCSFFALIKFYVFFNLFVLCLFSCNVSFSFCLVCSVFVLLYCIIFIVFLCDALHQLKDYIELIIHLMM